MEMADATGQNEAMSPRLANVANLESPRLSNVEVGVFIPPESGGWVHLGGQQDPRSLRMPYKPVSSFDHVDRLEVSALSDGIRPPVAGSIHASGAVSARDWVATLSVPARDDGYARSPPRLNPISKKKRMGYEAPALRSAALERDFDFGPLMTPDMAEFRAHMTRDPRELLASAEQAADAVLQAAKKGPQRQRAVHPGPPGPGPFEHTLHEYQGAGPSNRSEAAHLRRKLEKRLGGEKKSFRTEFAIFT